VWWQHYNPDIFSSSSSSSRRRRIKSHLQNGLLCVEWDVKHCFLEGLVCLIGAMVCLLAAPWVQLSVSADNGWPHNALQHHWLMPISCHFRDCKSAVGHESDSCKWCYSKCPDLYLLLTQDLAYERVCLCVKCSLLWSVLPSLLTRICCQSSDLFHRYLRYLIR